MGDCAKHARVTATTIQTAMVGFGASSETDTNRFQDAVVAAVIRAGATTAIIRCEVPTLRLTHEVINELQRGLGT